MMFAIVSFLLHPVEFVRGWRESRRLFDRDGYPRPGSGIWGDPLLARCPDCGWVLTAIHGDEWWCERCPWCGTERDRLERPGQPGKDLH